MLTHNATTLAVLLSLNALAIFIWHHNTFISASPTTASLKEQFEHYVSRPLASNHPIEIAVAVPCAPLPVTTAAPPLAVNVASAATQSCDVCVLDPDDPLCRYGIDNIKLGLAYEGSGYRIRKFLEKAMRGEPVSIGVLGASVTSGHGLRDGSPTYHQVFFADFQKMFPNAVLHEGAMAGMQSEAHHPTFVSRLFH